MKDFTTVHELEYDENNMPKISEHLRLKTSDIDRIVPFKERPYSKYPLSKEDLATDTLKAVSIGTYPSKIILNEFTDPKTYIVAESEMYIFFKMGT